MGIYNRDYMQDGERSGSLFGGNSGSWPPVCKWLIIGNVAVFLLQIFGTAYQVEEWLALDTTQVTHGQLWRLFTMAFCHDRDSVFHILFNMLFLWWFGKTLEQMYGSREFLWFYMVGALCASIAFVGLDLVTGNRGSAIGASGAVMAVTMLYAAHFPRSKIYIWFVLPVEIRWIVLAYVIFDLHPVLLALAGDQTHDAIAHSAHLGGLLFGFLYWKLGWKLTATWQRLSAKVSGSSGTGAGSRARPRRKIIPMPGTGASHRPRTNGAHSREIEMEVDRILQKIADQGASSLTAKERATLMEASERIKNRDQS